MAWCLDAEKGEERYISKFQQGRVRKRIELAP
jgi:hypothetical protein